MENITARKKRDSRTTKKITDLEKVVRSQQKVIQMHLEHHEQENEEFKKVIENIKEESYKGVAQIL